MQRQKPEIRRRILAAARDEFYIHGFKKASMRAMAHRAGITPGNIYAYFRGKEDLLDAVVAPTVEQMLRICDLEFIALPLTDLDPIVEELLKLFLSAKKEFSILIHGAEGSKYADTKQNLVCIAAERIEKHMLPLLPAAERQPLLALAWAQALMEGVLLLFAQCHDDEQQLRHMLGAFLKRLFPLEAP